VPLRAPSAELDLTIPQRTTNAGSETLRKSILKNRSKDANPNKKQDLSKKGQSVSGKSRTTAKQSSDRLPHETRSSRVQSASNDRRSMESRSRRNESSDSSESLPSSQNRPRRTPSHSRRGGIPPNDSNGDSSDDDRRDRNRRGRSNYRRDRSRRRQNPPSDDDDPDDGGDEPSNDSASDDNELDPAMRARKRLCIKLQKFDGTGSWESW